MYSLYPLGFLAAFLFWAMMNHMDKESEKKTVKIHKTL